MKTAEEFLKNKNYPSFSTEGGLGLVYVKEIMIEFARYHVKQALYEASRVHLSADTDEKAFDKMGEVIFTDDAEEYNTNQILSAYPLDNIK